MNFPNEIWIDKNYYGGLYVSGMSHKQKYIRADLAEKIESMVLDLYQRISDLELKYIRAGEIAENLRDENTVLRKERDSYREALETIAAEPEYGCEIKLLSEGLCECTCCQWARLAKSALEGGKP
jgi:hypothetical protein